MQKLNKFGQYLASNFRIIRQKIGKNDTYLKLYFAQDQD